ncbi:MAG: anthranilate synthase component I family protein [Pirellulales bacterium]|nr:anthranilate synthase component I family protein [Pirellulales bacterium]
MVTPLQSSAQTLPLVEQLLPVPDTESLFRRLWSLPHCVFFDSARRENELGRYSFLAADPFEFLVARVDERGALERLAERLRRHVSVTVPGLPPFQGGAAGLFSYDLGRQLERIPSPQFDEFEVPCLAVGLYDVVVACDHAENRAWIISQGWPETGPARRERRARNRLAQMRAWLTTGEDCPPHTIEHRAGTLPIEALAPQYAVGGMPGLASNFSREGYLDAVARAIEYIRAGDIFQVNLAQRLLYPAGDHAAELYLRLRRRNPATFAAYFDLGETQIASASPERFLRVCDGQVEARPIKGTRRRSSSPEADLFTADELRASDKDRAENVMIVDLLRNDLSRVCRPESVRVSELCRLELYEFVQHLVSVVEGTLLPGRTALDLLRAAFPGGSITGAPKVRAMEIIAELERVARGPYCGALGYLGFDGTFDANILIRTVTASRGWWQLPVGGGIVAPSVPEREYAETWDKAEGMLRALV